MSCRTTQELIGAYVDGEVTVDERTAVRHHLAECAACAELLESHRALKHGLSELCARNEPPRAVRVRVERGRNRNRAKRLRVWWGAAGLAAVAAIVVVFALADDRAHTPSVQSESDFAAELIADHERYAPRALPAEVTSNDPEAVRRFFDGLVPFAAAVPQLPSATLIGGRLCNIDGRNVELLFYDQADRRFSLYVTDNSASPMGCAGDGTHNVCSRPMDGLVLTIVGNAEQEDLRAMLASARW